MLRGAIVLLIVALAACTTRHRGVVYVDRNGDGRRQTNEHAVPGAIVTIDHAAATATDGQGFFELNALADDAIVWVRVPNGFRPGPVWVRSNSSEERELGLVPFVNVAVPASMSFVVGADAHVYTGNSPLALVDFENAVMQATARAEAPMFFTMVGDITQGNSDAEYDRVDRAMEKTTVPWVPVPGNHDWYDGGATWRRRYGPDNYSFDIGQFHFVVWDTNLEQAEQLAFFQLELSNVTADMVIVALGHDSPSDELAAALSDLGVGYFFTGHWHVNRALHRGDAMEWGTQPFAMGGLDASPAGYRVVQLDGVTLHNEFWPTVNKAMPALGLVAPSTQCVAPDQPFEIRASLATASPRSVSVRVDCAPPHVMVPDQAMSYVAQGPRLSLGMHTLHVQAVTASGVTVYASRTIEVCRELSNPPLASTEPVADGDAPWPVAPPLVPRWVSNVGGVIGASQPVVQGNTVLVSLTDYGQGDQGGVVALAADTGALLWHHTTPSPVVNSVAVDGTVVVVALSDGALHALDLATGMMKWQFGLNQGMATRVSSLWASPTVASGVVYIATPGRFVGLRTADGSVVLDKKLPTNSDTWLGSRAAVLIDQTRAIVNVSRRQGMFAFDIATGQNLWRNESSTTVAVNASPIGTSRGLVVVNSSGEVSLMRSSDGTTLWTHSVTTDGFDWGYSVMAAPTVVDDIVVVPTLWGDLVALDLVTGNEVWRYRATPGLLNFAHYRGDYTGFSSTVAVSGKVLWVAQGGGLLTALDVATGVALWQSDLGAPLAGAPSVAGDTLYVASFDGSVRAMVHGNEHALAAADRCQDEVDPVLPPSPDNRAGCGAQAAPASMFVVVMLVLMLICRRRCIVLASRKLYTR